VKLIGLMINCLYGVSIQAASKSFFNEIVTWLVYAAQPNINHDSPSALVRDAKVANYGSSKMVVSCKSGEQVMSLLN